MSVLLSTDYLQRLHGSTNGCRIFMFPFFLFTDFINAKVLGQCKKGIKIVNVGRGGLIQERDLLDGLNSGQVSFCHSYLLIYFDLLDRNGPKMLPIGTPNAF